MPESPKYPMGVYGGPLQIMKLKTVLVEKDLSDISAIKNTPYINAGWQ